MNPGIAIKMTTSTKTMTLKKATMALVPKEVSLDMIVLFPSMYGIIALIRASD